MKETVKETKPVKENTLIQQPLDTEGTFKSILIDMDTIGSTRPLIRLIRNTSNKISNRQAVLPGSRNKFGILKNGKLQWELGVPLDTLKDKYPNLPLFDDKGKLDDKYLSEYLIHIPFEGRIFDMEIEQHRFEHAILSSGIYPQIASSKSADNYSSSLFYFYDEQEEAKESNLKMQMELEASLQFYKLTDPEKVELLSLYGVPTKGLTIETANYHLHTELKKNPEKFLNFIRSPLTSDKALLKLCIEYRIIREELGVHYFNSSILGSTEEDAIKTLNKPENQKLKISLIENLKSARLSL